MPAHSPDQWRLSQLNRRIEELEAEKKELELRRSDQARAARNAFRRLRYLRLARRVRAPAARYDYWPLGLLLVGPLAVGLFLLAASDLLIGSLPLGLLTFVFGAIGGAIAVAALLFRPTNIVLPASLEAAESENRLAHSQLEESIQRSAALADELQQLIDERRELMASGQVQRAALLQRPWKAMAEVEWQDFVVEVCRTLGYEIERLPKGAEPDADFIASLGGERIAVLTCGEGNAVNSEAVQQAGAAMNRHGATRAAVIVNRRFTGAAQDFARHNGCTAIGREEFPDFVLGKLSI
jgi:HJR/Mrr/RecB family endonuclease